MRRRSQPAGTSEIAATGVAAAEPGGWLEGAIHRRLIVHTKSDKSYRGLLHVVDDDGLLLWAPELLPEKGEPVKLAGEVWIYRDEVHMIQTDTQ